ncbi:TlpA family protein disulfide reductase [Chryseobacterium scophthalmum]|uniref:TlpA family protein disulfide reductase n=2 Tax=Chryseobacterium TaxID=59732 RepID=UPI000C9E643B|nr:TlpA disulfide reductase family protein [Chryseobacterium scophthalmum]
MKIFTTIILTFIYNIFFSQNHFKITLNAVEFEKDSLVIGPPMGSGNIFTLYNLEVSTNQRVSFMKNFNAAKIKIESKDNIIEGEISHPQPFSISHYDPKLNGGFVTNIFFIEKGDFIIDVIKKNNLSFILHSESLSNIEYNALKEKLKSFDNKLKPFENNNQKDIDAKQQFLQNYIKKNPNSFVAFWEIVDDFSKFGFNKSYVKNLSLFTDKVKKTFTYITFKKIIEIENSTNLGGTFPDIIFENGEKIMKSDFSNYNLTLIDYWSTSCKPCINDLPKLTQLYAQYKNKNVNFISVTDEQKEDRIYKANKILEKNKVSWKNYFDLKREFPKKLNASGYPLQILVDKSGKIIARKMGELDQIDEEIKKHIEEKF